MKEKNKIIVFIVIVAFIFIGLYALGKPSRNEEREIVADSGMKEKIYFKEAVGQKAPDFELESIDGTTIKLSNYLGKNIVLFFNEGSMCYPACWNQIAELGNDGRFDALGIVAFSIVTDPKDQWLDIIEKSTNLTKSKILFDTTRSVSKSYDTLYLASSMHRGSLPGHTYFIIDKKGTIRFAMDDPNMALANNKLIKEIENLK